MKRAFAILALGLSCGIVWAADPPKSGKAPQSAQQPDTRSDHLRTESVKDPEKSPPPSNLRLNLNKASAAELMKLPGVDAAAAKAMIKGRPYRSKDEVLRKKILKAEVYEEIKGNLYAGM